ncbi:glutamate racemase [Desulfovibrio ferrophilus]|uniref:Glutamate racemase n=1 Tax=Desulfovibrio ferrophilus TaxID=241368 RepID=A0A2Z6AVU3_9BACT|nr:glutamate racemase [Desulfovibrio ferrophilus]
MTVLKALRERLPHEDFLYLGDTARLPYGTKSPRSIARYALQCTQELVERGVKMLVVACNTASSVALPPLNEAYPDLPVVGVVRPGARAGCLATKTRRIAVLATESTVRGGAYQDAIHELCPQMQVTSLACPLFVALAEEGWTDGPIVEGVAARYLDPLYAKPPEDRPDVIVLGCTHFPVLAPAIAHVAGHGVVVIDSAATTAQEVSECLVDDGLNHPRTGSGSVRFLATDDPQRFARVAATFLGDHLTPGDVTIIDL